MSFFFFFFLTQLFPLSAKQCQQRTKYKQRGCFQMGIFNVHAFFFSARPKEKYDAYQYYNNIFLFKQTKTQTGLHCRSLQTLSCAASTQNSDSESKYLTTIPRFL